MRETKFIEQNKAKWAEYEALLKAKRGDPDKMNELFIKITDDLSYARTYYPNRSVRVYLNELAKRIFHQLYKGKRFPWHRIKKFWQEDIPLAFWESRKAFLLAFGIFMLAAAIGVISSMLNPGFSEEILGSDYVHQTLENIKKGDPMAIYKDDEVMGMSVGIAFNNMWVAFLTMILGVLGSVGTVFILLRNGIMVGVFQYFFIERGLFWDSFLTIWIHGTLEIAAIIIAGAAGLVAGSGLLFPGTYTRMQALQLSIRRGLLIFIGISPLIIMAAMFEGFLTRFTETPDVVRGGFIFVSFAFVVWYFVYFPFATHRKGLRNANLFRELPPEDEHKLQLDEVKKTGTIMGETIMLLNKKAAFYFGAAALCSAVLAGSFGFFRSLEWIEWENGYHSFRYYMEMREIMNIETLPLWWIGVCVAVIAAFGYLVQSAIGKQIHPQGAEVSLFGQMLSFVMSSIIAVLFLYMVQLENIWWSLLLITVLLPLVLVYYAYVNYGDRNPVTALSKFIAVFPILPGLAASMVAVILGFVLYVFLQTPVFEIFIEVLNMSIPSGRNAQMGGYIYQAIWHFFEFFILFLMYAASIIMATLLYYSGREEKEANSLFDHIERIGAIKKIRGLARE